DASGLQTFVNQLAAGATFQQLAVSVATSAEYFQNRGGGTLPGFINALFQDVLGRPAGPGDLNAFQGRTQQQIATSVLIQSPEYTGALVNNFYARFLRRPPDGGGFFSFASALAGGRRLETVMAQILSSDEYFGGV